MGAYLAVFKILQGLQGFGAEEPLVGAGEPVAVEDGTAVGVFQQHLVHAIHHVGEHQVGRFPVGNRAPQGLYFQAGVGPGNVAGVDVHHVQSAVGDLAHGFGAGQAQFGEGRDRQLDLSVGAPGQVGRVVSLNEGAGGQVAVNADVLDFDALAGGSQLGGIGSGWLSG